MSAPDLWEYLGPGGEAVGPQSLDDMRDWVRKQFMDPEQKVRPLGGSHWVELRSASVATYHAVPPSLAILAPAAPGSWAGKAASNVPSAPRAAKPKPGTGNSLGSGQVSSWGSSSSWGAPAAPKAPYQQAAAVAAPTPVQPMQRYQQGANSRPLAGPRNGTQGHAGGQRQKSVGYVEERQWLFKRRGAVQGPFTGPEMREFLEDEAFFDQEVLVKKTDWKDYRPLEQVFEMIVQMYSLPPARPDPPPREPLSRASGGGSGVRSRQSSRPSLAGSSSRSSPDSWEEDAGTAEPYATPPTQAPATAPQDMPLPAAKPPSPPAIPTPPPPQQAGGPSPAAPALPPAQQQAWAAGPAAAPPPPPPQQQQAWPALSAAVGPKVPTQPRPTGSYRPPLYCGQALPGGAAAAPASASQPGVLSAVPPVQKLPPPGFGNAAPAAKPTAPPPGFGGAAQPPANASAAAAPNQSKPLTWAAMNAARKAAAATAADGGSGAAAAAASSGPASISGLPMGLTTDAPAAPQPPSPEAPAWGPGSPSSPLVAMHSALFPQERQDLGPTPAPQAAPAAPAAGQAPAGVGPQAFAAGPGALRGGCVGCRANAPVNMWLPCAHWGHCSACLPDALTFEDRLARAPSCAVCGRVASRYMRVYK